MTLLVCDIFFFVVSQKNYHKHTKEKLNKIIYVKNLE